MKTISVLALVVIMTASASALIVNNTVTWIGRPNTNGTPGTTAGEIKLTDTPISSVLEIGPLGNLTCNNSGTSTKNGRLTLDVSSKLIINGGVLNSNSNIAFPGTTNIGGMVEILVNSGTIVANKIETTATPNGDWPGKLDRYGKITLAAPGAVLKVLSGYIEGATFTGSTADRYNPWAWVQAGTLVAGAGYNLKFTDLGACDPGMFGVITGTHAVEITVVPEPATLSLLGLGTLAMLRKRK